MMRKITQIIATFCYLGYLPYAPGTWGSLGASGLIVLVSGNDLLYLSVTLLLLTLGFLFSGRAEKAFARHDAPQIVIDEAAGMFLSLLFIRRSLLNIVIGFVLFRIFDIMKPFPANRLQKLKGSMGIMLDDVAAGIYANLVLRLVIFLLGKL